jgi:hypothetical protein
MKARSGINSGRLTNNMSENCGGVKKAGIPNASNYPHIRSNVIQVRAPTKVPTECKLIKSMPKMHIHYSY